MIEFFPVASRHLIAVMTSQSASMQAELQTIFQNFANFGAGKGPASNEIDGAKFAKLCKVCCTTDRPLTGIRMTSMSYNPRLVEHVIPEFL